MNKVAWCQATLWDDASSAGEFDLHVIRRGFLFTPAKDEHVIGVAIQVDRTILRVATGDIDDDGFGNAVFVVGVVQITGIGREIRWVGIKRRPRLVEVVGQIGNQRGLTDGSKRLARVLVDNALEGSRIDMVSVNGASVGDVARSPFGCSDAVHRHVAVEALCCSLPIEVAAAILEEEEVVGKTAKIDGLRGVGSKRQACFRTTCRASGKTTARGTSCGGGGGGGGGSSNLDSQQQRKCMVERTHLYAWYRRYSNYSFSVFLSDY